MASRILLRLLSRSAGQNFNAQLAARVSGPCASIQRHHFSSLQPTARPNDPRGHSAISRLRDYTARRFKKRRGSSKNDDDDEESESEDEAEENPMLMNDDAGAEGDVELLTIDVNSLRLDAFAKVAFSVTRQRVEDAFYKGDLYINGERPAKKAQNLSLNDEVDLVIRNNPDDHTKLDIKRVFVVSFPDKASQMGRMRIDIKRWKLLTVELYPDRMK